MRIIDQDLTRKTGLQRPTYMALSRLGTLQYHETRMDLKQLSTTEIKRILVSITIPLNSSGGLDVGAIGLVSVRHSATFRRSMVPNSEASLTVLAILAH